MLTEEQVPFEHAKLEKEAHGEIETDHPVCLGSRDTFYVGTFKDVGRAYCYGKTPMGSFEDSLEIAKEKMLGYNLQTAK